jgi:hypothetical protein
MDANISTPMNAQQIELFKSFGHSSKNNAEGIVATTDPSAFQYEAE